MSLQSATIMVSPRDTAGFAQTGIGSALVNMSPEGKSALMGGLIGFGLSFFIAPKHKLMTAGVGAVVGGVFSKSLWGGIANAVGSPTGT